jgi:hypothetical protein
LCLHAGYLELDHPKSGKRLTFVVEAPFWRKRTVNEIRNHCLNMSKGMGLSTRYQKMKLDLAVRPVPQGCLEPSGKCPSSNSIVVLTSQPILVPLTISSDTLAITEPITVGVWSSYIALSSNSKELSMRSSDDCDVGAFRNLTYIPQI